MTVLGKSYSITEGREVKAGTMPKLTKIAEMVNKAHGKSFPAFNCKVSHTFCDSISISLSLDPRSEWEHGIFMNSRYYKMMVMCNTQFEQENSVLEFSFNSSGLKSKTRIIGKKRQVDAGKMAKYIIRQLDKIVKELNG